VVLPASVVTISAYQYFELIDLSATGAKLRGPTIPGLNKTALFRLNNIQVLCRVVWAGDEQCGIRFDEIIPAATLARLRCAGQAAQVAMQLAEDAA
jgi:hypothetical protein